MWPTTLFIIAIVVFCIGIFQDHRGQTAFVFYIAGLVLLAIAVLLLLGMVIENDFPVG
jgi:hypothetical protein